MKSFSFPFGPKRRISRPNGRSNDRFNGVRTRSVSTRQKEASDNGIPRTLDARPMNVHSTPPLSRLFCSISAAVAFETVTLYFLFSARRIFEGVHRSLVSTKNTSSRQVSKQPSILAFFFSSAPTHMGMVVPVQMGVSSRSLGGVTIQNFQEASLMLK